MERLELEIINNEIYSIVEFRGELDKANNTDVQIALNDFINEYKKKVLMFDFSYLNFINSEGVGMVVSVFNSLKESHKDLLIVSPNPRITDIFNTIGVHKIIPMFDSLDLAKSSL